MDFKLRYLKNGTNVEKLDTNSNSRSFGTPWTKFETYDLIDKGGDTF